MDAVTSIPYFFVHACCLLTLLPSFHPTWANIALCIGFYYLRMFGITAGYHRYFSHRAYKCGRFFQFVLAWLGTMALQKGVLWWAAHHRSHHKYSDSKLDVHSPKQRGFYFAHQGWFLGRRFNDTDWARIADFAKYPELRWLNQHYLFPGLLTISLVMALGFFYGLPPLQTLGQLHGAPLFAALFAAAKDGLRIGLWGGFVSTVFLWHGTFTINSLAHVWGSRRYQTADDSRNNFWLALLTMGEGWHNNHHHYQSTANQGFFFWEVDLSYYILKILSFFEVVWDLRTPPAHILRGGDDPARSGS